MQTSYGILTCNPSMASIFHIAEDQNSSRYTKNARRMAINSGYRIPPTMQNIRLYRESNPGLPARSPVNIPATLFRGTRSSQFLYMPWSGSCFSYSTSINSLWVTPGGRWVAGFPLRRPGFEPRLGHVGFVVDKVALRQVSSKYFGFPCQFSFHRLLHIHLHVIRGW
jgi:hypothetical protein